MTRATLAEVLRPALRDGRAVVGFVVLGWEDARAYVEAAEAEGAPVILQAGPGCRAHTPLPVLAAMFRHLAEGAGVPVVTHLDHGQDLEECRAAVDLGFTSVMYDGSALPFAQNVEKTAEVVAIARRAGVSVEAELGFVGYAGGRVSRGTDPDEVAPFWAATGVDALAVSVGNVHLMTQDAAEIDMAQMRRIAEICPDLPLVLHGGSGIAPDMRGQIARGTTLCKVNIGTQMRQVFGQSLRAGLLAHPDRFDRIEILKAVMPDVIAAARGVIRDFAG